jgi:hypothetical protein
MDLKPGSADYSNEDSNKLLSINSLIESIHEYFDPTYDHDLDYLKARIRLLCSFFEINEGSEDVNPNSVAISRLLKGYGELPSVRVLPFDGALEVPSGLDTSAHIEISNKLEEKISLIKSNIYEVQHAYLACLVTNSVPPHLREKTISLSTLIELGLPKSDPGSDELDY